jgi:uncharacterized protein YecT (DUF1311 family)
MKRGLLALLLGCAISAVAAPLPIGAPSDDEVLAILVQQSKLPASDIAELLSDCDAGQLSMEFCASRDVVRAELRLQRTVSEKERQSPSCKPVLDVKLKQWERNRNTACARSAARKFGGGSMERTVKQQCISDRVEQDRERVQRMVDCGR